MLDIYWKFKIICMDWYKTAISALVMQWGYHSLQINHDDMLSMQFHINTLRPRQDGRHFPDDIFKSIFLNENVWISINISPEFVRKCPINNIPALVQIMAWRRPGDKPLSEPMLVGLLTHICFTRPQWVNDITNSNTTAMLCEHCNVMWALQCYVSTAMLCEHCNVMWALQCYVSTAMLCAKKVFSLSSHTNFNSSANHETTKTIWIGLYKTAASKLLRDTVVLI